MNCELAFQYFHFGNQTPWIQQPSISSSSRRRRRRRRLMRTLLCVECLFSYTLVCLCCFSWKERDEMGERASSLISIERDRETGGDNKGGEGGRGNRFLCLSLFESYKQVNRIWGKSSRCQLFNPFFFFLSTPCIWVASKAHLAPTWTEQGTFLLLICISNPNRPTESQSAVIRIINCAVQCSALIIQRVRNDEIDLWWFPIVIINQS